MIQTTSGSKFGAFISAFPSFDPRVTFIGTFESLVFQFKPFKYHQAISETNKYYMHCNLNYISIGSGFDGPAIRIDEKLSSGTSAHCETFNSPILINDGEKHVDDTFEIYNIELFIL